MCINWFIHFACNHRVHCLEQPCTKNEYFLSNPFGHLSRATCSAYEERDLMKLDYCHGTDEPRGILVPPAWMEYRLPDNAPNYDTCYGGRLTAAQRHVDQSIARQDNAQLPIDNQQLATYKRLSNVVRELVEDIEVGCYHHQMYLVRKWERDTAPVRAKLARIIGMPAPECNRASADFVLSRLKLSNSDRRIGRIQRRMAFAEDGSTLPRFELRPEPGIVQPLKERGLSEPLEDAPRRA